MKTKRWLTATIFHISIIRIIVQCVCVCFNVCSDVRPFSQLWPKRQWEIGKAQFINFECLSFVFIKIQSYGDMAAYLVKVFNDHVDGCNCFNVKREAFAAHDWIGSNWSGLDQIWIDSVIDDCCCFWCCCCLLLLNAAIHCRKKWKMNSVGQINNNKEKKPTLINQ